MSQIAATPFDLAAVGMFALLVCGYPLISRFGPLRRRSIVDGVQRHRIAWMRNMSLRDNRVLDVILVGGLGQGNAFFASTSAIAIGGLAAMMGSGDQIQIMLERLPLVARASPILWELKMILMLAIFVFAFFKFAWAFRLSHYTSIMIGSTPIPAPGNVVACTDHADRTAKLIGIAAEHANAGIRAFYYAIAALAWFFHPLAFIAATVWVTIILIRRDFFSRSRRILSEPASSDLT